MQINSKKSPIILDFLKNYPYSVLCVKYCSNKRQERQHRRAFSESVTRAALGDNST